MLVLSPVVYAGTNQRETAWIPRDTVRLDNVDMQPSGRGIAPWCGIIHFVNVYAPSGSSRRSER
jgi:hypothetical protein